MRDAAHRRYRGNDQTQSTPSGSYRGPRWACSLIARLSIAVSLISRRRVELCIAALIAAGCTPQRTAQHPHPSISRTPWAQAELFTLRNSHGLTVTATTYGAIITSVRTPDRNGTFADIVLGMDSLAAYRGQDHRLGAIVGRYANRIANGRFVVDGDTAHLPANNGPNHLHGILDRVMWQGEPFSTDSTAGVTFSYTSPDREDGFPGTARLTVTYTLNNHDDLVVDLSGTTDRATPLNLAQHSYWNLSGEGSGTVLAHRLTLDADSTTVVDAALIPTGAMAPVAGTVFDFRTPVALGARIADASLSATHGYDHNYVIRRAPGSGMVHAAHLEDPRSGRTLDISTTEPGIQLYTGNWLDVEGRNGHHYRPYDGVALETQHYPDSPNHPGFPSTIVRPGETYRSRTVFEFR